MIASIAIRPHANERRISCLLFGGKECRGAMDATQTGSGRRPVNMPAENRPTQPPKGAPIAAIKNDYSTCP